MRRLLPLAAAVALASCASDAPERSLDFPVGSEGAGGKTDIFGRRLAGVAAPFTPNPLLADEAEQERLRSDIAYRRQTAWRTAQHVLEQVPLLGLAQGEESSGETASVEGDPVPEVPRWQTWYGIDDLRRIFQTLYEASTPAERRVHAAFDADEIDAAFEANATALDRSSRWPLERYLHYVEQLGMCPEGVSEADCARSLQSNFSGATVGNARILYSPATARHIIESYGPIMDCLGALDAIPMDAVPSDAANFTACFEREFPSDAVLIKAQWVRADFSMGFPAFDTDAEGLARRMAGAGQWEEGGDRRVEPTPDDILTNRLRNGDTYRLAGLHIMTKELRHWQWITLFWSEHPETGFGEDRPDGFLEGLDPVWGHYQLCSVVDYVESDPDPVGRVRERYPSLAAALEAVGAAPGAPTWCSNPYVEHGRNNARTNCIGCHQHGGATMAQDRDGDGAADPFELERVIDDEAFFPETGRTQQRELFVADYLYSFNRVDDFAGVLRREIDFQEHLDADAVAPRIAAIQMLEGDAALGEATFGENCARCHGADGTGTERAPSLYERVPMRTDDSILRTLIQGKGRMPVWGDTFDDPTMASLLAYLRATFGAPPEP